MSENTKINYTRGGIGLGTIIAVVISIIQHQTLWKIILHGILGWLYVIWYLIKFGGGALG